MSEALTLEGWLTRIEQGHPTEIELGLDRVAEVARRLGITLAGPRVITVAGTNGKGSTTCMLDSVLRAAGYRTGVYTSPHFLKYNERIQLDGALATDAQIVEAFEAIDRAHSEISLTYFEFGTLAALYLFERADLDFVILEVGLGGRLDAVNIIDCDIAVMTSIALDHVDWLGDNLESIGREKAGIFRAERPAVCGISQPPSSVTAHAAALSTPLYLAGQDFSYQVQDSLWDWRGTDASGQPVTHEQLPLPSLPLPNAAVVLQVIELLDLPLSTEVIRDGFSRAKMTGRMQRERLGPAELILDVAHNPEAAAYLAGQIAARPVPGNTYLVLGMLADKDRASVMRNFEGVVDYWWLCSLTGPRASTARELEALRGMGAHDRLFDSVVEALEALEPVVSEQDRVLVCGSFLTVTEALGWLNSRA